MKSLTIGDIKDHIQTLDTAIIKCLNGNPPSHVQQVLQESRKRLEACQHLCDTSLRIAILGEKQSGKTLLLNALLDTNGIAGRANNAETGTVVEVRVTLKREEKPPTIQDANMLFMNESEVWEIMNGYLKDLVAQGASTLPKSIESTSELARLEDAFVGLYPKLKPGVAQNMLLSALEFLLAFKHHESLVVREERHTCQIPKKLLGHALSYNGRPPMDKGLDPFYGGYQKIHEAVDSFDSNAELSEAYLPSVYPLIRKIIVNIDSWSAPFGIDKPESFSPIAFIDFPGLAYKTSNARDNFFWKSEVKDVHAVLVTMDANNAGASELSALLAGNLPTDRVMVAINRFDEFDPVPEGLNAQEYLTQGQGGKKGFSSLLVPSKNLLTGSTRQLQLYLCSSLCYLFELKATRSNWTFPRGDWFKDPQRQTYHSQYKRLEAEFKRLQSEIESNRKLPADYQILKQGIEKYVDIAGIPALRQDLMAFARERGERLIKENILKEFRTAFRIIDEVAPRTGGGEASEGSSVSSEVTFRAQEFYRLLELAVADAMPSGASEYKKLKVRGTDKDIPLWDTIETEITSQIASWPEWFAILNQIRSKRAGDSQPAKQAQQQEQKGKRTFSRYSKIKKAAGEVPTEFNAFNERFQQTAEKLSLFALEKIGEAILYSVQRFEGHPDYQEACRSFQSCLNAEKLPTLEEALPLLDAWNPTRMVEDSIVPNILERITDEVEELKHIRYPYDGDKPCFWNLALIIRIQVQLVKTLRDKVSRLIAAAENQFQGFFVTEVLRAEILPLVRSSLSDNEFLAMAGADVSASAEAPTENWDTLGQSLRAALEAIRSKDVLGGAGSPPIYTPRKNTPAPTKAKPVDDDTPWETPEPPAEEGKSAEEGKGDGFDEW